MSSQKPTFFFEPVSILIGRGIEETSFERVEPPDNVVIIPDGSESAEYFLNRTIYENRDDFEVLNVREEVYSALAASYGSVGQKFREKLASVISPSIAEILINLPREPDQYYVRRTLREAPEHLYIHKSSPSLIVPVTENTFCIISNEEKHVRALALNIKSQIENLSRITKDFGLRLKKILLSKEYPSFILESMGDVNKVELGDPRNTFEKEVIETCSQVTTAFLSNVTVQFKDPLESFEYDIFSSFPPRTRLVVEPTDYTIIKDEIRNGKVAPETLKSKVVLAMMDKAQRLRARGVVVTNGFPEDTFTQLKIIAESRGVTLMDERDYKEKLPNELCKAMLSALSRPHSRLTPRLVRRDNAI